MVTAITKAPPKVNANGYDGLDTILHVPPEAHTLKGFRRWALSEQVPEKLPLAFIQGEVLIDMSKEEIRTHALTKTGVAGALFHWNEEIDFGHLFINGVLVTNVEADVSNNPDIVLVSWKALASGRVHYLERRNRVMEIVGSPDLLVEIVSDSSVDKDTRSLRLAYHRAGVKEYWLIDARGEEIEFQILSWRRAGYVAGAIQDGWNKSRVLRRSCRLSRKKDRAGEWKYTLDLRENGSASAPR